MSNLKLITTENFGDLPCKFYRNMNDDILLTRKQIGTALEYSNPDDALFRIHKRHKDRLDDLSVVVKLSSTDGKEYDTMLYTQRGVMEICRWSNKPKANLFMDWVWDIVEKYRLNELQPQIDTAQMTNAITTLSQSVSALVSTMTTMQQDINTLKEQQSKTQNLLPKKKFSYWTSKMFPKYQLLMEYKGIEKNGDLYRQLYKEFQNTYPQFDLNQILADYCYDNKIESAFTLDAIEHDKTIRPLFESMVDNLLLKYDLIQESTYVKQKTIFDD